MTSRASGAANPWTSYLDRFHEDHPGITEDVLSEACHVDGMNPYAWLLAVAPRNPGVVALDLACGSGQLQIADSHLRLVGVDQSPGELARAARVLPRVANCWPEWMILSQAGVSVTPSRYDGGVKLSEWARINGVSRQSATRWFHAGVLPVAAHQLATGTILVEQPAPVAAGVAIYARVSSADQRGDLDRQVARLVEHVTTMDMAPTKVVSEVGSGLNGHRTKLLRLLRDAEVGTIVVEHRDRLARFGVEYLEAALAAQGRRLIVVEGAEVTDDLVRDMVEVLTSFCARLYGRRSAKRRAEVAVAAAAAGKAQVA